jgi:glycosyltransferase involved in cell wall biosynthesis
MGDGLRQRWAGRPARTTRPSVLFLTCHLPFPPISGGRRRELELIRRLGDRFDVHVWVVSKTMAEDRRWRRELARRCAGVRLFAACPTEPRRGLAPQEARHACPGVRAQISAAVGAGAFDLVHVEGFYLMQHVPAELDVPVLLTEQNVESSLWLQRALADPDPALSEHHRATRRAELAAWRRAKLCAALTSEDRARMREALPDLEVRLVPDGCDHDSEARTEVAGPVEGCEVAMVGNFAYQPNVDAALHLARDILPAVFRARPATRVALVGNAPPPEVQALAGDPRVTVTGRVPAVEPYLDAADVVVCPLRVGGGIKVKMLEALARGKAIVSTGVGVQGLTEARGAVRVEDRPAAFAAAVCELLEDAAARRRLERAALAAARRLPTWDQAAASLAGCYRELLAGAERGDVAA